LSKKVIKKGPPGECFLPLSENIENLCKVVPTSYAASGNPACGGAFADFQMFFDSRHRWPARQELPARKYRQAYPEKAELFRRNPPAGGFAGKKICRCQGVACAKVRYIFSCPPAGGLVLFVSRQKVQ